MATDKDIKSLFDEYYNEAYSAWSPFYPAADRDLRFYLGDQWSDEEKRKLRLEERRASVFNRVRRNINLITGYQRKNRMSSVVNPVENSDQLTADQITKLLLYVYQNDNGNNLISDCFAGACKTGWNLASVYMDYVSDPKDGDIKFCREPYSSFITDPGFTKLDFSDCNYLIKRKYLFPDQAAALAPKYKKEIKKLSEQGTFNDDKFPWIPYKTRPFNKDLVAYNEFFIQKWKEEPMLLDMETGETYIWDANKDRLDIIKQLYPSLTVTRKPIRYIEKHIIINDQVIETIVNPEGLDEYPCVPFIGIFESECDDWELKLQSLVRCQIDPQREANIRRSQMSDLIDSQVNSGFIADEGSVINPRSLFQTGQGRVIWRDPNAKPGAIEKIPPSQIPPSLFQLQELYDRDMVDILGLNDAAFGISDSNQESGLMMMLRQSSAVVNVQDVLDNLRLSQKLLSKKIIKLVVQWSDEKIERILGEPATERLRQRDLTKFDVSVGEGLLTDSQKLIYFRQLIDLKQLTDVPSQGPITAQMLVDAAPLQGKSELERQIKTNEQATQQAMAEQKKVEQQLLDSQRQMTQAKAISELALSKERFTRAVANMSLDNERASQAVSDRADASLARIKAIKEIQDLDDDRLIKYMMIIRGMEEESQKQEEEITHENVSVSSLASNESLNQLQDRIINQGMQPMQQGQQSQPMMAQPGM